MCFGGGGDSGSSSSGSASASSNVTFNPTISIGGNGSEPGQDTADTFAAKLLAAPPVKIAMPEPVAPAKEDDNSTKLLTFLAVALVARKVLRG